MPGNYKEGKPPEARRKSSHDVSFTAACARTSGFGLAGIDERTAFRRSRKKPAISVLTRRISGSAGNDGAW